MRCRGRRLSALQSFVGTATLVALTTQIVSAQLSLSPPAPASHILVTLSGNPGAIADYAVTPTSATLTQTVSIPGCILGTGANQAYGSNSADGGYAVFTCGTASSPNDVRQIVRIGWDGAIDTNTAFESYRDAYLPRGAASLDGSSYYAADGYCIYYVPYGNSGGGYPNARGANCISAIGASFCMAYYLHVPIFLSAAWHLVAHSHCCCPCVCNAFASRFNAC